MMFYIGVKFHKKIMNGFQVIERKLLFTMFKGASHFKIIQAQRPEIELVRAFMPVLVTSNSDDDSIKNEWASMETLFSNYKSMGNFLDAQEQLTP